MGRACDQGGCKGDAVNPPAPGAGGAGRIEEQDDDEEKTGNGHECPCGRSLRLGSPWSWRRLPLEWCCRGCRKMAGMPVRSTAYRERYLQKLMVNSDDVLPEIGGKGKGVPRESNREGWARFGHAGKPREQVQAGRTTDGIGSASPWSVPRMALWRRCIVNLRPEQGRGAGVLI